MKSVFVFMAYLALANAATESEMENPSDEGRLFYNINGLNATMLVIGVAILVGLLYYAVFAAKQPDVRADDPYGYNGYDPYQGTEYEGYQYQNRYRRFANNDIASKMAQLEQAFKKYQVEEAECEMYIACEASQVQRIDENGPLARIVYDILSTFNRAKDGHKWDDRMEGLVQAFEYGTGAQSADPCQPLRNKCFELHAKY